MGSERWLTRRAANGDREAFAAIFRRHQQDLYRYCVAILGDPDDAQDALQNTMVKALRALPGERREIALKPWLFRIAHNEAIELRRRDRPTEPLADLEPAAAASLEQIAAERGRLRELLADLGELPVRQRGALVMRELAGLDFEQIGAALETTPAAARQVLYEARRALREIGAGREMRCDAVTAILSDGDGRVARRRDVRAHLRDCPDCRAFGEEIRARGETLAAIAPLPALAAAAMIKGALAASVAAPAAAGGAAGAAAGGSGGAAGSVGTSAGGAGLAAGAAAKAGSATVLVKSAVGVVAILAVGVVAADGTHLLPIGGSGGGAPAARAASGHLAAGDGSGPHVVQAGDDRTPRASIAPVILDRHRGLSVGRAAHRGHGSDAVRPGGPEKGDQGSGRQGGDLAAAAPAHPGEADGGRRARGAEHSAGAAGNVAPPHPAHPTHPNQPVHPTHPDHPVHPTHPDNPTHPDQAAHPTHPDHPAHPDHPEHPAHPAHPASPEQNEGGPPTTKPSDAEGATKPPKTKEPKSESVPTEVPAGPSTGATKETVAGSPSETAPGQVRKAAEEEPAG